MNVKLTAAQKIKVSNTEELYAIMQQILLRENKIRRAQEHFWVIGMNNTNKIVFIELIALGASNRVMIDPPEVFRMAIYKMATQVVLVHNHPTGNMLASTADSDFTDRMLKVGKLIKISVIDHLIISETDFVSFENSGIMNKLRKSGAYEFLAKEDDKIKALRLEIERKNAKQQQAFDIARKMKLEGYNNEVIVKLTGLGLSTVKKL